MLQSIRDMVDIDNMKYEMEKYKNVTELENAITAEDKCPVIVIENTTVKKHAVHAVAAFKISLKNGKKCVKCKNSFGQNYSGKIFKRVFKGRDPQIFFLIR